MGPVSSLDQRSPTVRPKAIDTAFLFTLIGIVLGSVGAVVTTLLDHDQIVRLARDMLSRSGRPYTEADVLAMIGPVRVASAVMIALVAGLLVLVAFLVRAGRNWARIVLTGVTVFFAFDFLTAVSAEGAALELIWHLAGVAFLVTAVVYMFRPESTKYFAERRRVR